MKRKLLSSQGLSLIEILVAITIGALLYYVALSRPERGDEYHLEEAMDLVEKMISYSINESILRNRLTRVYFDLTNEKIKIKVEYGKKSQFALPDITEYSGKNLSTKEREEKKKREDTINSNFSEVPDLSSEQLELPTGVKILGIATSLRPTMVIDGEVSIYTYPSGERDRALVIFSIFEQIAALTIEPYTREFKRDFMELARKDDLEEEYKELLEKLLDDWSKGS